VSNDPRRWDVDIGQAHIAVRQLPEVVVLVVDGELDVSNITAFRATVADAMTTGAGQLVVDLTPASYIDSSGTSLMIELAREMSLKRGDFAVIAPGHCRARRVFELSGVNHAFEIYDDLEAALA
jgi:anti-sigma B factor antagonist